MHGVVNCPVSLISKAMRGFQILYHIIDLAALVVMVIPCVAQKLVPNPSFDE